MSLVKGTSISFSSTNAEIATQTAMENQMALAH
jgi:hypothetical protein